MATAEFSKFADILNKASGSDRIPGKLFKILKNDAVSLLHHPKVTKKIISQTIVSQGKSICYLDNILCTWEIDI